MTLCLMQAKIDLKKGDLVEYNPPFADPRKGQMYVVDGFPVNQPGGPGHPPYWVSVLEDKETLALALRHCLVR